jgi:hypothetical protein
VFRVLHAADLGSIAFVALAVGRNNNLLRCRFSRISHATREGVADAIDVSAN